MLTDSFGAKPTADCHGEVADTVIVKEQPEAERMPSNKHSIHHCGINLLSLMLIESFIVLFLLLSLINRTITDKSNHPKNIGFLPPNQLAQIGQLQ